MSKGALTFLALAVVMPESAFSMFYATSEIQGRVCSGFVIERCRYATISAAGDEDGRLYTVGKKYPQVSQHDKAEGRCWINTKSKDGGIWSAIANAAMQPDFYEKTSEGYKRVDVEYLFFECVERP